MRTEPPPDWPPIEGALVVALLASGLVHGVYRGMSPARRGRAAEGNARRHHVDVAGVRLTLAVEQILRPTPEHQARCAARAVAGGHADGG